MPEGPVPASDVSVGDELPVTTFPLTMHRLVVAAGATRDFAAIHHNDEFARGQGAPAMYANAGLLLGMWERAVRDYIGPAGRILAIRDFRMVRFVTVGSVAHVVGRVVGKTDRDSSILLEIELRTLVDDTLAVGPGHAEVLIP